jgi:ketosteroid isomerase-like protein
MATLATLEKQGVEQFAREFERLFYQGDFAAMASFYTEDAQLLVEDQELIQGRPAISRFWQAACQAANNRNGVSKSMRYTFRTRSATSEER